MTVYVDTSRIQWKRLDSFTGVWLRFYFDEPQHVPGGNKRFSRIDMEFLVNCDSARTRLSQLEVYDSLGGVHWRDMEPSETPPGPFDGALYWVIFAGPPIGL